MMEMLIVNMSTPFAFVCVAAIAGCVIAYLIKRVSDSDAEDRRDRRIELKLNDDQRKLG